MNELLLRSLLNCNVACTQENYDLFCNLGYPVDEPRDNCRYVVAYQPTINVNKLSVNQEMDNSLAVISTKRLGV